MGYGTKTKYYGYVEKIKLNDMRSEAVVSLLQDTATLVSHKWVGKIAMVILQFRITVWNLLLVMNSVRSTSANFHGHLYQVYFPFRQESIIHTLHVLDFFACFSEIKESVGSEAFVVAIRVFLLVVINFSNAFFRISPFPSIVKQSCICLGFTDTVDATAECVDNGCSLVTPTVYCRSSGGSNANVERLGQDTQELLHFVIHNQENGIPSYKLALIQTICEYVHKRATTTRLMGLFRGIVGNVVEKILCTVIILCFGWCVNVSQQLGGIWMEIFLECGFPTNKLSHGSESHRHSQNWHS